MGVQGLWEVLAKACHSRSLKHLAVVDGFEDNKSGRRGFRVGIDASIWYHHAQCSKGGKNPQLRLLFYRLRSLAELPLIPLFVFDGRERPKVKRGSRMGKSGSHNLTAGMKKLLDVFGMEWRMALGEAEAELASLNRTGVIDAIMTDDVDAFVFGARTIIRNPSLTLTGNKCNPALNSEGKASKYHVMVYTAEQILVHPDVAMSRGGLILFALLSGGDYSPGLKGFGPQIAHGLARCGFGDRLLAAYEDQSGIGFHQSLRSWRAEINLELHTNARGFLLRRYPSLSLPENFPDQQVLENYANPMCSARVGRQGGGALRDSGNPHLSKIAGFCENHFDEWGYKSVIIKRFRDLMWEAAIMTILRRAALDADEKEKNKRLSAGGADLSVRGPLRPSRVDEIGTPAVLVKKILDASEIDRYAAAFVRREPRNSPATGSDARPLMQRIAGARQHVSTDGLLEYRVEIDPAQLVDLASAGIKGKHPEPPTSSALYEFGDSDAEDDMPGSSQSSRGNSKKAAPDPHSVLRLWIPASIMRQVHPGLVEDFEAAEAAKATKRTRGAKRKARDDADAGDTHRNSDQIIPPTLSYNTPVACPSRRAPGPTDFQEMSNLPQRNCGFIFTFPDPDDPAMCIWGDEGDEEGVTAPNDLSWMRPAVCRLPLANELPDIRPELHRAHKKSVTSRKRKQGQASGSRVPSISDELPGDHAGLFGTLNEELQSLRKYDRIFDQILGIVPGPSSRKGKVPAVGAASRSILTTVSQRRSNTATGPRRQTTNVSSSLDRANGGVTLASFPPISPLRSQLQPRADDRQVRTVPRDLVYSQRQDLGMIDLSDSEDDGMSQHGGPAKRRRLNTSGVGSRRFRNAGLSSSQESTLSYRSLLDADDVIDLT